jgi:hypothetical protein
VGEVEKTQTIIPLVFLSFFSLFHFSLSQHVTSVVLILLFHQNFIISLEINRSVQIESAVTKPEFSFLSRRLGIDQNLCQDVGILQQEDL